MGSSVDDFYADIHQTSDEGSKLPVWHGELYLEFHRGTFTSHGSIKKGNRHSEILLRNAEVHICASHVVEILICRGSYSISQP